MTTQTKKFVDPQDIIGIQLTCKSCGTSLCLSRDELLRGKSVVRFGQCPSCRQAWTQVGEPVCEPTLVKFAEAIDSVIRTFSAGKSSFPAGFSITIEVKSEK
jgi:predicted hydrocarbon binding protein